MSGAFNVAFANCTPTHVPDEFKHYVTPETTLTCIDFVCKYGLVAPLAYLLERGLDPNASVGISGRSILYAIALTCAGTYTRNHLDCARLMIQAGARVRGVAPFWPLSAALTTPSYDDLARVLVLYGARASDVDHHPNDVSPQWVLDLERQREASRVAAIVLMGIRRFRAPLLFQGLDRGVVKMVAQYMFALLYNAQVASRKNVAEKKRATHSWLRVGMHSPSS